MEPEKFLTPAEFSSLLKAANDDRERCILLLLAGSGLRVGEMTQIRAEDIDFSKGYLHVQALNAKFNKPRTVVLLPKVAEVLQKQLAGRSKGWLFPSYRDGHISSRQVQNILDGIATRANLQEVKRQDRAGKNRHSHSAGIYLSFRSSPILNIFDRINVCLHLLSTWRPLPADFLAFCLPMEWDMA
jgi:integrase